ncbi:fimbrial protein [Pantoea sp. KPR_PJ]|uniref:fimbrial protein n=1 Tax=Pantoea sp. KPR_PJ TaxID=2738375 RepID=UPI003527FD65
MIIINNKGRVARFISIITLALSGIFALSHHALAASASSDAITLTCKATSSASALDFSSLNINISASVPVGTIVAQGTMSLKVKCALDNFVQFYEGKIGEVYFKRNAIPEGALGYGLTLYTGYNGDMTDQAGSVSTGVFLSDWALQAGGTVGTFTDLTISVPYQIVRTSASMEPSTVTGVVGAIRKAFLIGSLVSGKDAEFSVTNIKNSVTVKDETCSVASNKVQSVPLGQYSASLSSGLGSGPGQTSTLVPFDIQLNCENLLSGSFDVMMTFEGQAVSGLSSSGVLALDSATSTASGVGVQILNGDQQPVMLSTPFSVAKFPLSSALVTVPLYARYYQTADRISPGSANAVATYTLSYQ